MTARLRGADHDITSYLRQLRRSGFEVRRTKSDHWHLLWDGQLVTTVANSPGDRRSLTNIRSDVARFERSRQESS